MPPKQGSHFVEQFDDGGSDYHTPDSYTEEPEARSTDSDLTIVPCSDYFCADIRCNHAFPHDEQTTSEQDEQASTTDSQVLTPESLVEADDRSLNASDEIENLSSQDNNTRLPSVMAAMVAEQIKGKGFIVESPEFLKILYDSSFKRINHEADKFTYFLAQARECLDVFGREYLACLKTHSPSTASTKPCRDCSQILTKMETIYLKAVPEFQEIIDDYAALISDHHNWSTELVKKHVPNFAELFMFNDRSMCELDQCRLEMMKNVLEALKRDRAEVKTWSKV